MARQIKKIRAPGKGWRKFAADVEAAAKKKRKPRKKRKPKLENLRPGRVHLLAKAPRCKAIARISGKRCRQAAVRGAQRCYRHGGLLEVPDHPANIKALQQGEIQRHLDRLEANERWYAYDPHTREQVLHQAKAIIQGTIAYTALASGAAAFEQHDNGKAFRRWANDLKHAHNSQQHNRTHMDNIRLDRTGIREHDSQMSQISA